VSTDRVALTRLAAAWRDADPDPTTRAAVDGVLQRADDVALDDLFGHELEFGTAGLRAPLGPGPNRMNRLVVRRTAVALALHLRELVPPARRPVVVVGQDARHGSVEFGDGSSGS
jgi:phosphomannomutase